MKTAFDWKVRKNINQGISEKLGTKVIYFKDAFHGRTGYTLSMTNTFDQNKTKYFPVLNWPRIINPKITFPFNNENNVKVEELENSKKQLEEQMEKLENSKKVLKEQAKKLVADKTELKEEIEKLQEDAKTKDTSYPDLEKKIDEAKEEDKKTEEKIATIGISSFAQEELGDVVFVEMPKIGQELKNMDEIGVVESVKTVSTLFCPISGKVIAINEELNSQPALINQDPYNKGWIIKIEMTNPAELDKLLSAKEYQQQLAA